MGRADESGVDRRGFLCRSGGGIGAVALAALLDRPLDPEVVVNLI